MEEQEGRIRCSAHDIRYCGDADDLDKCVLLLRNWSAALADFTFYFGPHAQHPWPGPERPGICAQPKVYGPVQSAPVYARYRAPRYMRPPSLGRPRQRRRSARANDAASQRRRQPTTSSTTLLDIFSVLAVVALSDPPSAGPQPCPPAAPPSRLLWTSCF